MLETKRLLQPTFKASWFNIKAKKILRVRLISDQGCVLAVI